MKQSKRWDRSLVCICIIYPMTKYFCLLLSELKESKWCNYCNNPVLYNVLVASKDAQAQSCHFTSTQWWSALCSLNWYNSKSNSCNLLFLWYGIQVFIITNSKPGAIQREMTLQKNLYIHFGNLKIPSPT